MMSNQPETFTCHTCDHSWKKGQSGSHNCADLLIKKVDQQAARIAKLEQQLNASIDRESGSDIAADMAMNSVDELQTRTIQQAARIDELKKECAEAGEVMELVINTISAALGADPECLLNPDASIEGMAVEAAQKAGEIFKQFGICLDADEGEFIAGNDQQAARIAELEKVLKETQWHLRKSPAIKDTVWCNDNSNTTLYERIEIALGGEL